MFTKDKLNSFYKKGLISTDQYLEEYKKVSESKVAFITGVTGQDGSYLAELLLSKGYVVHGLIRRTSQFIRSRIDHLHQDEQRSDCKFFLHYGDVLDEQRINFLIKKIQPDEIYHLAAQSHVGISYEIPDYTIEVITKGTRNVLNAVMSFDKKVKMYNASSSEMYGNEKSFLKNEQTPFIPISPYALAKVTAHELCLYYRNVYGLFICNGILMNHESSRRGENFVTKKIVSSLIRMKCGFDQKLYLGNINAMRDWGYAPEYVEAMWLMLQQDQPDDFVIATGYSYTVLEFLNEVIRYLDIERFRDNVIISDVYKRPFDVEHLMGDSSKAKEKLGWKAKVGFYELIKIMVDAEMESYIK